MPYRAVLFDLDGTLLDTLDGLADAMNRVLARSGYPTHDRSSYRYFVGNGLRNTVWSALPPEARDDTTFAQCFDAMQREYSRCWPDQTKPYPGIPELIAELQQRGLILTILSNKIDEWTQQMASHYFAPGTFSLIFGERAHVPRKPDPSGALEIADRLQIPPEQFLYLGDTRTDMETATTSGMVAVGVTWGFRPAEELKRYGARHLIDHPLELLQLLPR
ncbi:phosphoglycolate phosphatase [Heliophilum fasciatum]|uniref:Phosphoglycolate phosphatase n=2 Tax=Heliophilum fasciatum TaxID=35700 RepID=A0A4R2RRR2_9FIRM|nr:phosphoglycolate phosphatase [Heliophilum fasciatum]